MRSRFVAGLGGGDNQSQRIIEVTIMSKVLAYLREEDGASAAEYALILAIVGTAIALAMIFLGGTIANTVDKAGNCIATPSTACS